MRARWPLVVSELKERTSVLEKRCEVLRPDVYYLLFKSHLFRYEHFISPDSEQLYLDLDVGQRHSIVNLTERSSGEASCSFITRSELVSTHAHSLGTANSQLISFHRIIFNVPANCHHQDAIEVEVCQGAVIIIH